MNGRIVIDQLLQDRLRGVVVGSAIGDALGMPLEFKPPRPVDQPVTEMTAGRLPAGRVTDDTEMALALAESLLAERPLNMDDLAQRFVAWAQTDPPDIGNHTRAVLSRTAAGEPWDEAVEAVQKGNLESAGNGSLMRAWPIAVAYWSDFDNLLIDSWRQSRVTHPHRDCMTACTYVNVVTYHLLHGMPPDTALTVTGTMVRTTDDFYRVVMNAAYQEREMLVNSGWVIHTLQSAVWGLFNTHSFEEALISVVNLGNDADTAGAVVGAMAGAAYGLSAIPHRWKDALRAEWPVGSGTMWTVDDLIDLADRLVAGD
jgi:ADP-ribosyl-[dinitrogen reductase] hydrolase